MQLNSESELTDHLAQKQHQIRVKDAGLIFVFRVVLYIYAFIYS